MAETLDTYSEYADAVLRDYERRDEASRNLLFDAVKDKKLERILDVGCSIGHEFFPFLEKSDAVCYGVDIAEELGVLTKKIFAEKYAERVHFVRSTGEFLPFADKSFDAVLCRVTIPYMNNKMAIAEVARVLKKGGVYLLKTHAPPFYFRMIAERAKSLNPKQVAYPVICLAASIFHSATGKQLENGIWRGKEIFQTRNFLEKEFAKHGMKIEKELADTNPQSPSYFVVKTV
ncbi:MAG TPA: class I SAM-dependent methyltransferase [Pyrinomonadaceae bacterium]|nr:class I SAM-dependent methyltransferase [Pyrinomonadaceae bacterium]